MDSILISYAIVLFSAAVANSALAIYSWQHRAIAGTRSFTYLVVGVALWLWCAAASAVAGTEATAELWGTYGRFTFVVLVPVLYFLFTLDYTGNVKWLSGRRLALILTLPAITVLLTWTGEFHQLFVFDTRFEKVAGLMLRTHWERGPWFWIYLGSTYPLILIGLALLTRRALSAKSPDRQQTLLILLICMLPFAGSIPPTFQLTPPWLDLVALTFSVTVMIVGWALLRYQLLDIMPLARDAVIENMADGVMVLDANHRLVDLNREMRNLLQLSWGLSGKTGSQRLLGMPVMDLAAPWPALHEQLADDDSHHAEISLQGAAEPRHYDLRISSLDGPGGNDIGKLVVLRDISRRKEAEDELHRYAAELEATNRDLDTYARSVAHDLKSPLITISGFLELLKQDAAAGETERMRHGIETIGHATGQMAQLIDALLLMARVRQSEVEAHPLDMAAVVATAQRRLQPTIHEMQAVIRTPSAWPVAGGDPLWIEEVWVNYLSNALKYGGEPPVIQIGSGPERDHAVRFWVRDNGPGIALEDQPRLFEPFTRLSDRPVEGHGLGLSIVQRIVEKLGGETGVESRPGAGTLFYFTLPRLDGLSPN